jgi:hypothetical protein
VIAAPKAQIDPLIRLGISTISRRIQLQQRVTLSMKANRSKTQRRCEMASWGFSERAAEF